MAVDSEARTVRCPACGSQVTISDKGGTCKNCGAEVSATGTLARGPVLPPTAAGGSALDLSPGRIALVALLTALTTVFIYAAQIPVPATNGYLNLSDVAIVFTGLVFGPQIGMVAGGLGAALGDISLGYTQYWWLSLIAHGLEGLMVGLVGGRRRQPALMVAGWLVGALAMVAGYLVGEGLVVSSWPAAIVEAPLNALQAIVGGIVGIPLAIAVRRAYPPIDQVGRRRRWRTP